MSKGTGGKQTSSVCFSSSQGQRRQAPRSSAEVPRPSHTSCHSRSGRAELCRREPSCRESVAWPRRQQLNLERVALPGGVIYQLLQTRFALRPHCLPLTQQCPPRSPWRPAGAKKERKSAICAKHIMGQHPVPNEIELTSLAEGPVFFALNPRRFVHIDQQE